MRNWLLRWSLRWTNWIANGAVVLVSCEPRHLQMARALCASVETRLGPGFGDAKRRDVYAALMKRFPEASKRALSLALEIAIRG